MKCFHTAQMALVQSQRNTPSYYQKTVAMYNCKDLLTVEEGWEVLIEVTKNFFNEIVETEISTDEFGMETEVEVIKKVKIDERTYVESFLAQYTENGWVNEENAQAYIDKLDEFYPITPPEEEGEEIDPDITVEVPEA